MLLVLAIAAVISLKSRNWMTMERLMRLILTRERSTEGDLFPGRSAAEL
jgi:hypothetical protein